MPRRPNKEDTEEATGEENWHRRRPTDKEHRDFKAALTIDCGED